MRHNIYGRRLYLTTMRHELDKLESGLPYERDTGQNIDQVKALTNAFADLSGACLDHLNSSQEGGGSDIDAKYHNEVLHEIMSEAYYTSECAFDEILDDSRDDMSAYMQDKM